MDAEADAVLERAIEAGWGEAGEERSVKTVVISASFAVPAQNITAEVKSWNNTENGDMRTEIIIPGFGTEMQGVKDGTVWANSAITGPRLLEGDEAKEMLRQADFYSDLEYKTQFTSREFLGTEEVDGRECKKVRVTRAGEQNPETRWYDAESGLLVKQMSKTATQMGEIEGTTMFSDYRDVEGTPGLKVPFKTTVSAMGMQQVITIKSIEINGEIPADTFAPPPAVQKLMG